MIPHFALLIWTYLLALVAHSPRVTRDSARWMWLLIFVAMALFGGLRGDYVGADTIAYVNRFERLQSWHVFWDSFGSGEIGVKALYALSLMVGETPTTFLMLSSALASFLYLWGVSRLTPASALSLFVFVAFGFYTFHLNGLRQALAIGFYLLALPHLLRGNFMRYAGWVVVATLFHTTAIFTLPMYAIFRLGYSAKTAAALLVMAAVFVAFPDTMIQFAGIANERYVTYSNRSETGGNLLMLFHVLLSLMFVFGRRFIAREWLGDYDKLLLMMVFGSLIYLMVTVSGSYVEINRLALYFTVSMAFLWPMIINSQHDPLVRMYFTTGLIIFGAIFYYIFLSQIGAYTPYETRV